MNLLFVCLGNICRSPMAEGIMRHIYAEEKGSGQIESAGTADWNVGNRADPRAISVCRAHAVDISKHRARQVRMDDFERFDIIFAMDNSNLISLRKIAPAAHMHKIHLLGGMSEIADPYYSNEAAFHAAYKVISEYCHLAMQDEFHR